MDEEKSKKHSSTPAAVSKDSDKIGNWQGDRSLRKRLFEENGNDASNDKDTGD